MRKVPAEIYREQWQFSCYDNKQDKKINRNETAQYFILQGDIGYTRRTLGSEGLSGTEKVRGERCVRRIGDGRLSRMMFYG